MGLLHLRRLRSHLHLVPRHLPFHKVSVLPRIQHRYRVQEALNRIDVHLGSLSGLLGPVGRWKRHLSHQRDGFLRHFGHHHETSLPLRLREAGFDSGLRSLGSSERKVQSIWNWSPWVEW